MESWLVRSLDQSSAVKRKPKLLRPRFYERDTLQVAADLLGKILVAVPESSGPEFKSSDQKKWLAGRIVEVEAYHGEDPASHSSRGKTPRCAPMFEKPGMAYVYFIYGMYEMLNFVTERENYPGAVLIRGLEVIHGQEEVRARRAGVAKKNWSSGPGRLSRALGVQMKDNRASLQGPRFYVFDDGHLPPRIQSSPRVGIREAKRAFWRFYDASSEDVSRVKENDLGRRFKVSPKKMKNTRGSRSET